MKTIKWDVIWYTDYGRAIGTIHATEKQMDEIARIFIRYKRAPNMRFRRIEAKVPRHRP